MEQTNTADRIPSRDKVLIGAGITTSTVVTTVVATVVATTMAVLATYYLHHKMRTIEVPVTALPMPHEPPVALPSECLKAAPAALPAAGADTTTFFADKSAVEAMTNALYWERESYMVDYAEYLWLQGAPAKATEAQWLTWFDQNAPEWHPMTTFLKSHGHEVWHSGPKGQVTAFQDLWAKVDRPWHTFAPLQHQILASRANEAMKLKGWDPKVVEQAAFEWTQSPQRYQTMMQADMFNRWHRPLPVASSLNPPLTTGTAPDTTYFFSDPTTVEIMTKALNAEREAYLAEYAAILHHRGLPIDTRFNKWMGCWEQYAPKDHPMTAFLKSHGHELWSSDGFRDYTLFERLHSYQYIDLEFSRASSISSPWQFLQDRDRHLAKLKGWDPKILEQAALEWTQSPHRYQTMMRGDMFYQWHKPFIN